MSRSKFPSAFKQTHRQLLTRKRVAIGYCSCKNFHVAAHGAPASNRRFLMLHNPELHMQLHKKRPEKELECEKHVS